MFDIILFDTGMLAQNLIKIESQIVKKNTYKDNKNFYKFVQIYEKDIEELRAIIIANKKEFSECFVSEVNFLKKMNLTFNSEIIDEVDYLAYIVSIFLIKTFFNAKPLDISSETDSKEFNSFESDSIINGCLSDLKSFFAWIEIFFNKNKIKKAKLITDWEKIRLVIYRVIVILSFAGKIKIIKKWHNRKSLNFYIFKLKPKNFIFISLYKEKFKIYKKNENHIYLYNDHYTNVFELLRENKASGARLQINTKSKFIKNALKIKAMIDYESLEYFFAIKLKKLNYNRNDLYEYYHITRNALEEAIEHDDKVSYINLSKKMAELWDLIRIYEILNAKSDDFFYFPFILCFRGRTYFSSSISFTFYKEFRYCLYTGEYDKNFKQPYHFLNKKIEKILLKHVNKLNTLKYYSFNDKKIDIKFSVLWIIISIAEIKKKELGSVVSIEEFLDYGIKILNKEIVLDDLDEYDELKLYSLEKILKEIDKNIFKKRLISKDATASCFQHLIKVLGYKDEEALKRCNLKSISDWYDTYMYILNKWLESLNLDEAELIFVKKYFNRSTIKKVTMTYQYGAVYLTCWIYFKAVNKIKKNDLTEEEYKKLEKYFKSYFNFISQDTGLLDKNPSEITKALKDLKYQILLEDHVKVNLIYYIVKTDQDEFSRNKKRYTKQRTKITTEINYRKINTSSRANYIHTLDAAVVRHQISNKPVITVHDCFLIDYRSTTFLIALSNEAMQKTFHNLNLNTKFDTNEIFSIFIII